MHQQQTAFENIVGKGEIARNEQFLLFPQCFLLNQIIVSPFVHIFDIISLFSAELEQAKVGILRKGLTDDKYNHCLKDEICYSIKGKKTFWAKEKMLVNCIFFIYLTIFRTFSLEQHSKRFIMHDFFLV